MQDNLSVERPNFFAIIPANIRYDKTISASEKLFYAEISALAQKDGRCWASRRYFADLYGVDERTISRWTTRLTERGYIEVRVLRNEKNAIVRRNILIKVFHTPSDKNVSRGGQKCPYPSDKNVADNNTSNNKVSKKEATARPVENFNMIIEKSTDSKELRESLIEFVKFRKLIKKPMTNKALDLIVSKLNKIGKDDRERVAIVNQSIERGWAGVFPLKEDKVEQPQVNPYKLYNMPNYGLKEIPR